jgi:uncharacterized protein YcbX
MHVGALRRYPVKSMGGEDLDAVAVDTRGLAGDRWWAVVDEEGRLASGKDSRRFRRRDAVFGYAAATGPEGVVVARGDQGWTIGDPALDRELSSVMRAAVRVLPEQQTPHQDGGQVSLVSTATLRWCAERWGDEPDVRRLRINVLVEAEEPFVEETWVGRTLEVGTARLVVAEQIPRCRMIDLAQDGVTPTTRWLGPLSAERGMDLGVYATVGRAGRVAVGDAVLPA